MISSERATARLAAAASSTAGRFVLTWRLGSALELASAWRSAAARVAVAVSSPTGIRQVSGCATELAALTVSGPANAAGLTASGPSVVNPPAVLVPLAPTVFSAQ